MHPPPPLIKILKIGKFWVFCFKFFFWGGGAFPDFQKSLSLPFPLLKTCLKLIPLKFQNLKNLHDSNDICSINVEQSIAFKIKVLF